MLGLYSPEEILKIPSQSCTPVHTHALSLTPMHIQAHIHTCTHPRIPMHPWTQPHTPTHACTQPRPPAYTRTHPCTPVHTRTHSCTLAHTPHIHTHALNLIDHMKLYVNRPNTKKQEREREIEKKEQGSAEAISGLKS